MKLVAITLALASAVVAQVSTYPGLLSISLGNVLEHESHNHGFYSCYFLPWLLVANIVFTNRTSARFLIVLLDAKCICASDSFISGIACCLAGVCNADEQNQAVDFARSFCSTQGVTDLPQSVTCTQTPLSNSTTTPTATSTPSAAATPNAGSPVGSGSSAGVYGGLLAVLAML
ncbi:hypothetical protein GQX73_g523 [Xylaria multiplex]|uniref:CFEM domain-containing protein n=1 Tax=Xylaria multiplex TaxID=323545 RepID=A0A7C8NDU9_9PEZI|nr:hypothetical protein GQX73_g523 [Xylaria multiplex]